MEAIEFDYDGWSPCWCPLHGRLGGRGKEDCWRKGKTKTNSSDKNFKINKKG